jgi:hypothetical protein
VRCVRHDLLSGVAGLDVISRLSPGAQPR